GCLAVLEKRQTASASNFTAGSVLCCSCAVIQFGGGCLCAQGGFLDFGHDHGDRWLGWCIRSLAGAAEAATIRRVGCGDGLQSSSIRNACWVFGKWNGVSGYFVAPSSIWIDHGPPRRLGD